MKKTVCRTQSHSFLELKFCSFSINVIIWKFEKLSALINVLFIFSLFISFQDDINSFGLFVTKITYVHRNQFLLFLSKSSKRLILKESGYFMNIKCFLHRCHSNWHYLNFWIIILFCSNWAWIVGTNPFDITVVSSNFLHLISLDTFKCNFCLTFFWY